MIRIVIVILLILAGEYSLISQDTWSIIFENDTLAEAGQDVLEVDDFVYIASNILRIEGRSMWEIR